MALLGQAMTLLAQRIADKLKATRGLVLPEDVIDSVLRARDEILKKEENYGPGFNRDSIGYRTVDGETSTYIRLNRR